MCVLRKEGREGKERDFAPEQILCLGFLALILIGGVLLALPAAATSGESIGLGNGLFTATSAICVTGLVVVDTGTTFSLFGQLVLLTLIQVGGLGFMVFATLIMLALGRRITLKDRVLMRESMNASTLSGLTQVLLWYGAMALIIEVLGAMLLSIRMVPLLGWGKGLYYSFWHAVSAFCNAGFDLFGGFSSLTAFQQDPLVLLTIAALIILGGMGFAVITEILSNRFRWRTLSLHARLVMVMTVLLLALGTVCFALAEWHNPGTLGSIDGAGNKLLNAFFQSVTMRTAGFNTVDLAAMQDGSKLVSVLLMLTGAAPASTGGGMKITTIAVLGLVVWSAIRGEQEAVVMKKRIPRGLAQRALTIVSVTLTVFLGGTLILTTAEGGRVPFEDVLMETASAIATVGVSSAGTPGLGTLSRIVLVLMMYLGRVGPMTMALALARKQEGKTSHIRYPEENLPIG